MTLRFSVLASSSSGNALYVATDKQRLLIDCGLSGKKMTELLHQTGCDPSELDGLLVTHEHRDHVKGLGVFARRYPLPVYANEKTWQAIEGMNIQIPAEQKFVFRTETVQSFADVDAESFAVSHDAAEPMFFVFHHGGRKLVLATDLGYVSGRIKGTIRDADMYIFEANHDINMLMSGRYPWNVKRRILGDLGHVSNEDSAQALADVIGERTKGIYLAHLSQDNNMKDLARLSVQQTLQARSVNDSAPLHLYDTDPAVPTDLAVV